MNQPKKRKRLESTRSQASGISSLSNITRSTDDLNQNFQTPSPTSRYTCNGFVQQGSRTDLINVVQPQINCDRSRGYSDTNRERRVSFTVSDDEEEETFVKEFNGQFNQLQGHRPDDNFQYNHHQQCVDVYAQTQMVPQASAATINCDGRNCGSNMQTSQESEAEILRRKVAELQGVVAFLSEKDKRNTTLLLQQRRSASVMCLQASHGNQEHRLHRLNTNNSQTNVHQVEVNTRDKTDRVFGSNQRQNSNGVPQRRSRSCDYLLDDEEREQFAPRCHEILETPNVSSGYEKVTQHPSNLDIAERDNNNNDDESMEHLPEARRFNFCHGFVILLVVNAIFVSLNVIRMTIFNSGESENICINCSIINEEHILKFQKMGEKCCLDSASEMLQFIVNVTRQCSKPEEPPKYEAHSSTKELPMVQYVATGADLHGNVTKIAWDKDKEHPIQKVFEKLSDGNTIIKIPEPGIYFIYTNIHFIKYRHQGRKPVTFGHSIVKLGGGEIDSASATCFPSSDEIRHKSHLSFIHNFTSTDEIYVRLESSKHFLHQDSKIGIFYITN